MDHQMCPGVHGGAGAGQGRRGQRGLMDPVVHLTHVEGPRGCLHCGQRGEESCRVGHGQEVAG